MKTSFIRPEVGSNSHLRYFVSFVIIAFFMLGIGGFIYGFLIGFIGAINPKLVDLETFTVKDTLVDLYLSHIINIFWILGIWFVARTIHKRSLKSFITANPKINWKRVFLGFIVVFALLSVSQIIDMAVNPQDYKWNDFDTSRFIWLLVASILLVPIQTTSEELFFRGFLVQWIGKLTQRPIVIALIIGAIFGVLHFSNPEMSHGAFWVGLDYVFTGFIWTYIAVRTNSIELTIGAHTANNMFLCIFLTEKNSVYGLLPSLFVMTEVDAMLSTIYSIIISTIFCIVTIYYHKKQSKKELLLNNSTNE